MTILAVFLVLGGLILVRVAMVRRATPGVGPLPRCPNLRPLRTRADEMSTVPAGAERGGRTYLVTPFLVALR